MRALVLLLLAGVPARAACVSPVEVAVGARSLQPVCNYSKADLDAEGPRVAAAWMTYFVHGFGQPTTSGTTAGGMLDARGRLQSDEQQALNDAPGYPSVATNGTLSLLAWARTSYGTFAQFLDAEGAPLGPRVKISASGASAYPPRAVWNGTAWMVYFEEQGHVSSVRLATDGTLLDRRAVASDAKLADADGLFVVVSTSAGFELVTPTVRFPLPAIPAGATVALDRNVVAWHAGEVGAQRLASSGAPQGPPIALAAASRERRNVAVAGDVVLWNDVTTLHGARLGGSVQPIARREGNLLAATATTEGVVALLSGPCFSAESYFLAPGAGALVPVEIVSRLRAAQSPQALVPTARGHHAYWTDTRPLEGGTQLFVTAIEGAAARPPVKLNAPDTAVGHLDAARHGSGSVVAFSEFPNGRLPGLVKLVRVDGSGAVSPPVTIGTLHWLQGIAVTARGDVITVYTAERPTYAWIVDLWRSDVGPGDTVTREMLESSIDGFYIDAAMTPTGPLVIWADNLGTSSSQRRLNVRDAGGKRVFTMPAVLDLHRAVDGARPMILRQVRSSLHAFFPDTQREVLVAENVSGPVTAAPRPDGSFDVAVGAGPIRLFHVRSDGLVTPRAELCFGTPAAQLSLSGGTVDAILTSRDGSLYVAKRPPRRRRAAGE